MAFMLQTQGVDHDSGQHGRQRGAGVTARRQGAEASEHRGHDARMSGPRARTRGPGENRIVTHAR
jgi:hypothetical protein